MMVYPPVPAESTSRSSLETPPLCQTQAPASLLPQQQQLLYAPYNTIPTCVPATNPAPCIYANTRRNPLSNVALRGQDSFRGVKSTKWHTKPRSIRVKDHQPPPSLQHPIPYPPPPLVIFDPVQNHLSTPSPAPLAPVYLGQASSCFNHGPYPVESYANFNPNAIPQAYYKPPEVQTFCLVPDRQSPQNQFHQQPLQQSSYYNVNTSSVNLQNIKTGFPAPPSAIYPITGGNDGRIVSTVPSTQLFPNPSMGLSNVSDKLMPSIGSVTNDLSGIKYPDKTFLRTESRFPCSEGLYEEVPDELKPTGIKRDAGRAVKSPQEERYSDESNFDFTIEAEKMVSALCNTSSHELDKDEEERVKGLERKSSVSHDTARSAENASKNFKPWYLDEFSSEPKLSGKSVGTQTQDPLPEESQYPELIRKMVYWGCNEAEVLLKNSAAASPRQNWLLNLSAATRIALAKSSTCFPVFSGDKAFSQDLINSLLRIGNGWLILDHYLNKQHHPSLNDKFDDELAKSFKKWEASTYDLLGHIIKSFVKLEANSVHNETGKTTINSSFPGDVSLYVACGLFGDPPAGPVPTIQQPPQMKIPLLKPLVGFNRNLSYPALENQDQKYRWAIGKESKLRTKWTITEQSRGSADLAQKLHSDKPEWKIFTQEFPVQQIPLINEVPQQKLQYNFLLPQADENSTEGALQPTQIFQINRFDSQPCIQKCPGTIDLPLNIDTSIPIPLPTDEPRPLWNSCMSAGPLYNNFPYSDTTLDNLDNRMTLLSQIETKRTEVQNSNEGETINLSAWFASMRNRRVSNVESSSSTTTPSTWWGSTTQAPSKLRESSRSAIDLAGSSRMDINRQLRTLRNMRTIQSAPWTANHLLDDHRSSGKRVQDEYDSSEDVRVYMKPGSYNVPKKKYQSRRSHRRDSSRLRNNSTRTSQAHFGREDVSCTHDSLVPSRSNVSSSSSSTCSQDAQRDATWKAACASAELLLDALKVKEASRNQISPDKILNSTLKTLEDEEEQEDDQDDDYRWQSKDFEDHDDEESTKASSYEPSEEDSESCKLSSLDTSGLSRESHSRTNVKTDSWLIRTLNNVSNGTRDNISDSRAGEESSTPMITEVDNETSLVPWKKSSDEASKSGRSFSLETSHTIAVMTLVDVAGKATYSETVRRFSSTAKPSSLKPFPQKLEENSEKSLATISECREDQEGMLVQDNVKIKLIKSDRIGKGKKCKNQPGDRGWSVWYSSRRKQHNNGLGPVALGKLVSIHRALWRMDVTRVFKSPTTNGKAISGGSSTGNLSIENYRKIVKSPMFLETIGHKLKNHVYRKVEHVIRDFRRIVHNSKLYHKNDKDSTEKIEALSRKLEELIEENFADELPKRKTSSPLQNRISPNLSINTSDTCSCCKC